MRFLWVLLSLAAALLWWLLQPRVVLPDDASGGLSNSSLIQRCQERLLSELGAGFLLPNAAETASQITSSSEEKRWDGWVRQNNRQLEFSCQYTAASDVVVLEVIR
jgi:hypothetical protein